MSDPVAVLDRLTDRLDDIAAELDDQLAALADEVEDLREQVDAEVDDQLEAIAGDIEDLRDDVDVEQDEPAPAEEDLVECDVDGCDRAFDSYKAMRIHVGRSHDGEADDDVVDDDGIGSLEGVGIGLVNKFAAAGFESREDLGAASDDELLEVPQVGPTTVESIRTALEDEGDQEDVAGATADQDKEAEADGGTAAVFENREGGRPLVGGRLSADTTTVEGVEVPSKWTRDTALEQVREADDIHDLAERLGISGAAARVLAIRFQDDAGEEGAHADLCGGGGG